MPRHKQTIISLALMLISSSFMPEMLITQLLSRFGILYFIPVFAQMLSR